MKKLVVAIDGPAGAGKSTVAQLAAKELGYTYIDTGAMYRAVAWKVLQQGGEVTDEKILAVVPDIDVDLSYENGKTTVRVDGQDVTSEIRTPEVSHIVSKGSCARPRAREDGRPAAQDGRARRRAHGRPRYRDECAAGR